MENIIAFLFIFIIVLTSPKAVPPETVEPNCLQCHQDVSSGQVIHKAMKAGCDLCHESTGVSHPDTTQKAFKLSESIPDLCYLCHDDYRDNKYHHDPVGNCMTCHTPHNSSNDRLLHTKTTQSLCQSCHEDVFELVKSSPFLHQPAGSEGNCIDCHSPHSSMQKRLILEEDQKLCLKCHDKSYSSDSTSIPNMALHLKNNKMKHSGLDGGCSTCHLPHASDFPRLLLDAYPTDNYAEASYENFSFCFLCHDSDLLEVESTIYATNFRNGEQNLHFLHTKGKKGRSCRLCHDVHASPNEFIIEKTVPFGNWEMEMNFVVLENGGSCLPGCHVKMDYSRFIAE